MTIADDCLPLELDQIALSVSRNETDPQVLALACLAHLARNAIRSAFDDEQRSLAKPLVELGDKALFHYTDHLGIPRQRVQKAIQALERASEVYTYLRQLPD